MDCILKQSRFALFFQLPHCIHALCLFMLALIEAAVSMP